MPLLSEYFQTKVSNTSAILIIFISLPTVHLVLLII